MNQPDDLLQAVAQALAGEDGCCCLWNSDGRCCQTKAARAAFQVIAWRTGLTLEWLEGAEKIHEAKKRKRAAVE
jgi:hypothetical protein